MARKWRIEYPGTIYHVMNHPQGQSGGRQRSEQALEARRRAEEGEEFKPIRRGWCLGEATFRQD